MQYGEQPRAARDGSTPPTSRAPASSGPAELDNSAADARAARAAPGRSAPARLRQLRRGVAGAEDGRLARSRCIDFLRDLARRARPYAERDLAELREFARSELGLADLQAWDLALREREAEGSALRLQRPGGEAVLHRTEGARRPVPHHRDAVRGARSAPTARRSGTPSVRFFRIERGAAQLVGQFYLDLYARTGKRPGAWMDDVRGRWARPEGSAADAGRAPGLQLRRRRVGGTAGAADARRRHHAVPRVRPRPAPHADAGRRPRRLRHLRRRVGRGRAAEPVHGELLLGVGRASSA